MLMSTPAKRRRIDNANETLRKPFKSPGLVRGRNVDAARETGRATSTGENSAAAAEPNSAQDAADATSAAATRQTSALLTPAKQPSKPTHHRPFSTPRPSRGVSQSPLRTTTTTPLANRLSRKTGPSTTTTPTGIRVAREVEGREEIIRQAERIRGASSGAGSEGETDQDLVALIEKWRAASRQAAEEVYAASRERVQSMGGMRAWRRTRMEEQKSFMEMMMGEEERQRPRDRDCGAGDEDEAVPSPAGGVGAEDDEEEEKAEEDEDENEVSVCLRGVVGDMAFVPLTRCRASLWVRC